MKDSFDRETPPSHAKQAPQQSVIETGDTIEYDSRTDTYRTSYDGSEPISMAIVSTVAAASGTDSRDSPPLYAAVDPDALDDLVSAANGTDLRITFTYNEYRVAVDGDGHIAVTDADD